MVKGWIMELKLPEDVISTQDLKAVVIEIRRYAKWFAQANIKLRVSKVGPTEPPSVSPVAFKLITEFAGQQVSQKSLDTLLLALEAFATKAPHVSITLAAVAPGTLRKTMVAWWRRQIDPRMLVDFHFNSAILGGMVVRYGSHVYDWSFRQKIMNSRDIFPETLRRV